MRKEEHHQETSIEDLPNSVEEALEETNRKFDQLVEEANKRSPLKRFPLLFTLLATFGAVLVLYSFEQIADTIPLIRDNPFLMLAIGLLIMVFTGTLYKKLLR